MNREMKEISYIGFYNNTNNDLNGNMSAINKMNYLVNVLNDLNLRVNVYSTSWTNDIDQDRVTIDDGMNKYTYFKSRKYNNKFINSIFKLFFLLITSLKIANKSKKNEKVIIYHSPFLIPLLVLLKLKRVSIILEVEEIYSKVWDKYKFFKLAEFICFKISDSYLIVNSNMKKYLPEKDMVIFEGDYKAKSSGKKIISSKKINVVYAGSIERTKNAAFLAVESARFLPSNYTVNIIGYGTDNLVSELKLRLKYLRDSEDVKCNYLGSMDQKSLNAELANYDIGLNSQCIGDYMETAFPSKLLVYMSNGLKVVSTPINSIMKSDFSKFINFSENDSPEAIAKCIQTISVNDNVEIQNYLKLKETEFKNKLMLLLY